MSQEPNILIKLFWRIHPKVYAWTSGRIGGQLMGLPVLLLTTRGRKSGLLRTKALTYLPYNDDYVVIASNLGQERHPMWWLNLQRDPNAQVQIKSQQFAVRAREAQGDERKQIWRRLIAITPDYDDYKDNTSRQIPVVVLERLDDLG